MSGLELVAVVACVGAIISAYHDGAQLVAQIKAKRKAKKASQDGLQEVTTQELESSLYRGQGIVQSQFDRDARRFGDQFRVGDRVACEQLKDVIIHLQGQMIANLKIQWRQETILDFSALQDVSDGSQDRVVMILLHLQQRIIMAGPIENMKPPPLFWEPNAALNQLEPGSTNQLAGPRSAVESMQSMEYGRNASASPYHSRLLPPSRPPSNSALPSPSAYGQLSSPSPVTTFDSMVETKPKSVTRIGLFGRKKKDPVAPLEAAQLFADASSVPQYLLPAVHGSPSSSAVHRRHPSVQRSSTATSISAKDSFDSQSRVESVSTRDGSIFEADQLDHNPWAVPDSNAVSHTNHDAQSTTSSGPSCYSQDTRSVASLKRPVFPSSITIIASNQASISAKDLLPSEANRYSGFCKGAWRFQIGDKKKATDERQRPGSMYNALRYWQCSRCKFEGRLVQLDKKTSGYDRQVMLADGIQFRWEFLFKSHVECRDAAPNPLRSTFGCIFCCAEGRGTPTFGGAQSFMDHLQEHRVRLPVGEVLYRMNCRVGRKAAVEEDFDINFEAKDGITF
ncbi:MAG: hypothetical protein Q9170_004960 [Blastenia crenularia]